MQGKKRSKIGHLAGILASHFGFAASCGRHGFLTKNTAGVCQQTLAKDMAD